jgi:opacity protein-like surface antigen
MVYGTARKIDWIFALDAIYFKITDQRSNSWQGPFGNTSTAQLNVGMTQQNYSLSAGRRVLNEKAKVDVLGVARYTGLDTDLKLALTSGPDLLPGSRSVSAKESWWDAAIAVRVSTPIASKWDLTGYADVGAGGTDLSYQLLAGLNWQFSKVVSAKIGYRYFYQDYQKGDFKWDMTNSGGYLGVGFRF